MTAMPPPLVRNIDDFLVEPSIWELAHLAKTEADRVLAERAAALDAATTVAFAADVSQYQGPLTAAYPWRGVIFRLGEGDYRKDARFDVNYAAAKTLVTQGHLDWFGVYHVGLKPGVNGVRSVQSQVDAVNSWLGGRLHPAGFLMQDAENWSGKQGGDLSAVFNGILEGCIPLVLAGDERRTLGYANGYDWANLWPSRPAWLKRTVAAWGTTWPGTFGWQYRGGTATPVPAGYPSVVAPWGAVDLNAFVGLTHQDVAAAFGIGADMTTVDLTDAAVSKVAAAAAGAVWAHVIMAQDGKSGHTASYWVENPNEQMNAALAQLAAVRSGEDAITAAVNTLKAALQVGQVDVDQLVSKLMAAGLPLQLAQQFAAHVGLNLTAH